MSKVEVTDTTVSSSGLPTTTSSVPTNLTLAVEYDDWQPNPTPFETFVNDPHLYRCTTGGAVRSAYTMDIRTAYTFDAADQLHSNQSVTAFELRGVLYALGSGPDSHRFTDDTGRNALFDGVVHPSSLWEVDEQEQHCVQATWRFEVPPSLRRGTFEIVEAPPNMALFVQSAGLIYLGDSTSQTDTLAGVSTSATAVPSAQQPSNSSSSPNLGVIIPAILVPVLVISGAIIAFVSWRKRQQRRKRLAPSAAFRQDHAATIARGVEGGGRGASPVPSNANAYIPLDEKRAFNLA